MTVLFWVAGFFVWYLVGLIMGLFVTTFLNFKPVWLDRWDRQAWLVWSLLGPYFWSFLVAARVITVLGRGRGCKP